MDALQMSGKASDFPSEWKQPHNFTCRKHFNIGIRDPAKPNGDQQGTEPLAD